MEITVFVVVLKDQIVLVSHRERDADAFTRAYNGWKTSHDAPAEKRSTVLKM